MIVWLRGTVLDVDENYISLMTQQIAYGLFASEPTRARAKKNLDSEMSFFIHAHIREDQFSLYAFEAKAEKELFLQLHSVSGLGPRTALNFFSNLDQTTIAQAIAAKDIKTIQSVPGVGKKTAERVCLELSDKMPERMVNGTKALRPDGDMGGLNRDLYSALANLGYRRDQVDHTLSHFPLEKHMDLQRP